MDMQTQNKITFGNKLRFTPTAWAKFIFIRDIGPTEVAAYGITGTEDPLLVTDLWMVKQTCDQVSFDLDKDDIHEHMERVLDADLPPWAGCNLLVHTHPGNCPNPSQTDENNYEKAFSHPDWAIMMILARDGSTYCRLKVNKGPGVQTILKVEIDYSVYFAATDRWRWKEEYDRNVITRRQKTLKQELDFDIQTMDDGSICMTVEEDDDIVSYYYYELDNELFRQVENGPLRIVDKPNKKLINFMINQIPPVLE